jgi:hypothetical protein
MTREYIDLLPPKRWSEMTKAERAAERDAIYQGAIVEFPGGIIAVIGVQLEKDATTVPVVTLAPNDELVRRIARELKPGFTNEELLALCIGTSVRSRMRVVDAVYGMATATKG